MARVVWAPLSLQTNWQFHLLTHISKALILARWLPCFAVLLALSSMPPARRSKHAAGLTHVPFIHLSTLKGNWQMIIAKITCPPKLRNVMQKAAHFQMIWPEIGFFSYFLTNFKTTGRGIFFYLLRYLIQLLKLTPTPQQEDWKIGRWQIDIWDTSLIGHVIMRLNFLCAMLKCSLTLLLPNSQINRSKCITAAMNKLMR